jgi:hypothetical protein
MCNILYIVTLSSIYDNATSGTVQASEKLIFHLYNAIKVNNEKVDKINTDINHIACKLDDKITELEIPQ